MFRRFAYQFGADEGDDRGWERGGPHHHRNWWGHRGQGPRSFGWHMRRKFFGRGGPFGPEGPFGPGGPFGEEGFFGGPGRGKHFFGRGDLKYVLLELLQERPMHGYEMMKALQERTGGRYTPSAGSVYPTLQMLEDRGFVTVSEADGKKVYQITDAGREFLGAGQSEERGPGRRGFWETPESEWAEVSAFWHELREVGPMFGRALHQARRDPEKLRRLHKLLEQVRAELASIASAADDLD
jgi:DNA-binding PadR family transcriptional regulator